MHSALMGRWGLFDAYVMHSFRREQADAGVPMLFVVPRKENLAETPGVLDATEALRKVRTILNGFELGL